MSMTPTECGDLIERLKAATVGGDELSARVMCALLAPSGAYVERSPYNGAWCIYHGVDGRSNQPRLWDKGSGKQHRPDGWPVTTSVDAALAMVERVLPGWIWSAGNQEGGAWAVVHRRESPVRSASDADAPTPALALCIATLEALRTHKGEG